jgi:caffeoyl-CoA O-methyltransferase
MSHPQTLQTSSDEDGLGLAKSDGKATNRLLNDLQMTKKLEQFLLDHTTPEDPVLEDLFRQTHIRFVNPNMATGHLQGKFLEFISRMICPENILEIGTFTGYSSICLARGLRQTGKLVTIELNDELKTFAHDYFIKAELESKIIQMTGRAQDIIPSLDKIFDLVFIDGDKREYTEYYKLVIDKVKPGGFILADNIFWGGKALDKDTRDPQSLGIIAFNEMIKNDSTIQKVTIPLRDGLMLIRKKE